MADCGRLCGSYLPDRHGGVVVSASAESLWWSDARRTNLLACSGRLHLPQPRSALLPAYLNLWLLSLAAALAKSCSSSLRLHDNFLVHTYTPYTTLLIHTTFTRFM